MPSSSQDMTRHADVYTYIQEMERVSDITMYYLPLYLFWMQTINEDDLTEIAPMLSTDTVQIYVYIEVSASLRSSDILLTCT
jgi:hypothetical protein